MHGTFAPIKSSFFQVGVDVGLISGDADVGYYSVAPFVHYALYNSLANNNGWYIGAGGSYYIAEYDFPEGKLPLNIFAVDAIAGFRFINGLSISYTMRTNFSTASNTIAVGYRFRFNKD